MKAKYTESSLHVLKRRALWSLLSIFLLVLAAIFLANYSTVSTTNQQLYSELDALPADRVGLVLGCSPKINGRPNLYFTHRIDAAESLWKAHKVKGFLVSGDNRTRYYNEPQEMKNALIERGVPAENIYCDYAGLRTLDSIVRAKQVFGCDALTIISQPFHNQRACYIANHQKVDAIAFNAQQIHGKLSLRTNLREYLARVKMMLDLYILQTQPTHLGKKEQVPF